MSKRLLVERSLQDSGQVTRRVRRSVTVNQVESPLGWLHRHGHLDQRQFDAGEQLRIDWERANLSPCVTMRWDPAPGLARGQARSRTLERTEQQASAKERFDAALASAGPGMADILWRIVCAGEGMREAETALGWPARAGKLVLKMALDRLAEFYRIREAAQPICIGPDGGERTTRARSPQ
jgi:hypothetical protein